MTTDNTHEHKQISGALEGAARRTFMRAVLNDLRALDRMVAENAFERGVSRVGAEQEMFLVAGAYHPPPGALKIRDSMRDPRFTTELVLFQVEANADPQPFAGHG